MLNNLHKSNLLFNLQSETKYHIDSQECWKCHANNGSLSCSSEQMRQNVELFVESFIQRQTVQLKEDVQVKAKVAIMST